MRSALLEVNNLRTHYQTKGGIVKAVDGVSFRVQEGQIVGLAGESGCGKTTLGMSIIRVLPKYAKTFGEILFDGHNLLNLSEKELREIRWKKISVIPQAAMNSLDPVYTLKDQMFEAFRAHGYKLSKSEMLKKTTELLNMVGLHDELLYSYPHQLSGGMKQRAIIAMSIALNPSLVIADEPVTALDVIVQNQILEYLKELQQKLGLTVIMITHDVSVIARICDQMIVMYAGKFMEMGSTIKIFKEPCHPYTLGLKNSFPNPFDANQSLLSIPGYPPNLINPPKGCRFADRCPFSVKICFNEEPLMTKVDGEHWVACHRVSDINEIREKAMVPEIWREKS